MIFHEFCCDGRRGAGAVRALGEPGDVRRSAARSALFQRVMEIRPFMMRNLDGTQAREISVRRFPSAPAAHLALRSGTRNIALVCRAALLLILVTSPAIASSYSTTFFVSPHQDDWELFMGQNSINDVLNPTNSTVFIYTTAGDAGCGAGCLTGPNQTPYYLVRNEASIMAMEFAETLGGTAIDTPPTTSMVTINGHAIGEWSYGSVTAFFLNLPNDYAPDGGLFDTPYYQFATGSLGSLSAVDGSTTYTSFSDLTDTMADLVSTEVQDNSSQVAWVNTLDYSQTLNPDDHGDHYASGLTFQAAVAQLPCVGIAYFQGYASAQNPINMDTAGLIDQTGVFASYQSERVANGLPSNFTDEGSLWLGRQYLDAYTPGSQSCLASNVTSAVDSISPGSVLSAANVTSGPLITLAADTAGNGVSSTPEPTTLALLGTGVIGLVLLRRRSSLRTA